MVGDRGEISQRRAAGPQDRISALSNLGRHVPISKDRLSAYMRKAVREGKERSSWTEPNVAFEESLDKFIDGILADPDFAAAIESFLTTLIPSARAASLSQTLLRLTATGVPDIYQGMELWGLQLVDPDNRTPVDFDLRKRLLAELDTLSWSRFWPATRKG